ncbi:MAG: hypothetical protein LQ340_006516, partial [Diploschistes diacapsis]
MTNKRLVQCYAITVLQAIAHHPRLAYLLRYNHMRRGGSHRPRLLAHHSNYLKCPLCELYEFLVRYWTRPSDLAQRAQGVDSRKNKLLARFRHKYILYDDEAFKSSHFQQDAAEFYVALWGWIEDYLANPLQPAPIHTDESPALAQLMKLQYVDITTCEDCKKDGHEAQERSRSLSSALLEMYLPESTDKAKSYTLEKKEGEENMTARKRLNEVKIPEELDLTDYCVPEITSGKKYRLLAVIKHRGETTADGHYIVWTRNGDDWFKLNDRIVQKATLAQARSHNKSVDGFHPYLLFYELIYSENTSLPPTPTKSDNADARKPDSRSTQSASGGNVDSAPAKAAEDTAHPAPKQKEIAQPGQRKRKATDEAAKGTEDKRKKTTDPSIESTEASSQKQGSLSSNKVTKTVKRVSYPEAGPARSTRSRAHVQTETAQVTAS